MVKHKLILIIIIIIITIIIIRCSRRYINPEGVTTLTAALVRWNPGFYKGIFWIINV